MSRNPLQMRLFEPTMTQTVEVTEIDGQEPGGILKYFDLKDMGQAEVQTCPGDIFVICNALEDYANILEGVIAEWSLIGFQAAKYQLHAARCRKISRKYAAAVGYDYQAAIERCKKMAEKAEKKDDVGEDSLILAMRGKEGKR